MNKHALISNYLAALKVDLFASNYGTCHGNWKDIDYTPDYNKFYFIRDGEGWLKIGDKEYYPKPGQLIFMPEGVLQSYSTISSNTFQKHWCHFSAKVGDINLVKILDFNHTIMCSQIDEMSRLFQEMNAYFNSRDIHAKLMAKVKLLEIISYFITTVGIDNISIVNSPQVEKLNNVIEYINEHLYTEIAIQDLARVACMHPNYLSRFFKEQMGIPPIHYINRKRMERAKELLISTNCSISELCERVGIPDLFYFSKLFKKNVGLSPTEFRHTHTKEA